MVLIWPSILPRLLTKRWKSYLLPLWKTTGMVLSFPNLRLHLLWAAPRYFPVKWQWSLTFPRPPSSSMVSPPQIQQVVAASNEACSSSVIIMGLYCIDGEKQIFRKISMLSRLCLRPGYRPDPPDSHINRNSTRDEIHPFSANVPSRLPYKQPLSVIANLS